MGKSIFLVVLCFVFFALSTIITYSAIAIDGGGEILPICGNYILEWPEACDDGNTLDGDYCSSDCMSITGYCGDNVKQSNEGCDDGNTITELCPYGQTSCTVCSSGCTLVSGATRYCGDSTINGPEECDDGNTITESCAYGQTSCTVCGSSCLFVSGSTSYCGDGSVQTAYEQCEIGQTQSQSCGLGGTQTRTCTNSCVWGTWGTCTGEGVCSPGQTQSQSCGYCGTQSRTCLSNYQWGSWGTCTGQGVCLPGSTISCSSLLSGYTGTAVCTSSCAWDTSSCSVADTTPPVRSNGAPTGTLASSTTSATLSLTTNENANCKYDTRSGITYGSMTSTFSSTGGTSHSTTLSGLLSGASYAYYVRCIDSAGNANTDDYTISFSIAAADNTPPSTSVNNVEGDTVITYYDNIDDGNTDIVINGEVGMRCEAYTSDVAYTEGTGTACTTSGSQATCTIPTSNSNSYTRYIACRDSVGNKQSAEQNLFVYWVVDATAPTVVASHQPLDPKTFDSVEVSVYADDAYGINDVQIYVDGALKKICYPPIPENICRYSAKYAAGTYTYYGTATDIPGNTARAPVTGTHPFTVIQASEDAPGCESPVLLPPDTGGVIPQTVTLTADATKFVDCVKATYMDSGEPYTVSWSFKFDDFSASGVGSDDPKTYSTSYAIAGHKVQSSSHTYLQWGLHNPSVEVIVQPEWSTFRTAKVSAQVNIEPSVMDVYSTQSSDGGAPYVVGQKRTFEATFHWQGAGGPTGSPSLPLGSGITGGEYRIALWKGAEEVQNTGWQSLTNVDAISPVDEKRTAEFTFTTAGNDYKVCAQGTAWSGGAENKADLMCTPVFSVDPGCASSGQTCNVESDCCNPTDNYCASGGKCCRRGERWDPNRLACVRATGCGPSPVLCNFNILTNFNDWLSQQNCRSPNTPIYKQACVPVNYGIEGNFYYENVVIY